MVRRDTHISPVYSGAVPCHQTSCAIRRVYCSHCQLIQEYADDTQLHVAISKDNNFLALNQIEHGLVVLHTWFCHNSLALNPDKSDAIIFGTAQRTRSLPNLSTVNVAGAIVSISDHIKLLGLILASGLTFNTHISALSKSCFFHNRALRQIRPSLTTDSAKSIARSLIGGRLEYANASLVSISDKNTKRLQRIQNTLTRVVTRQCGRISISKTLKELHWLPVKCRIDFKVATTTYKLLESNEPAYLRSRISV